MIDSMTPLEQLRRRELRARTALKCRDEDGLLTLFLKLVFGRRIWRIWFGSVVRFLLRYVWSNRDYATVEQADAVVRRAMDVYIAAMTGTLVLAYFVVFFLDQNRVGLFDQFARVFAITFTVIRLGGLASLLCQVHLGRRYTSHDTTRAILNGFWNYGEIIVAFGTIYALVARYGGDGFNNKEFLADCTNPLYFSFQVMTTISFGEFKPQTILSRCLITIEYLLGLLFIVFAIGRAIAASMEVRRRRRIQQQNPDRQI